MEYPSGWHLATTWGCGEQPGALVSNLVHPYADTDGPNSCTWPPPSLRSLPSGGAVVLFEASLGGGLTLSRTLPPDTPVPITISELRPGLGGLFAAVTFHHVSRYSVDVWIGPRPSSDLRSTVEAVLSSIRPWARQQLSPRYGRCVDGWERERVSVSAELGGYVNAVDGVSATDIWAVGSYSYFVPAPQPSPSGEGGRPYRSSALAAHWDGTRWAIVPPATNPPGANGLEVADSFRDVAAISPTDVWAVGGRGDYGVIERWDGERWQVVPSPSVNLVDTTLVAVDASRSDDVWAVGSGGDGGAIGAIVEHWDGRAWGVSRVPPDTGTRYTTADDVSASSPTDAWVVGQMWDQALAMHWDGTRWRPVPTPEVRSPRLKSVVDLAHDDAWAVGTSYSDVNGNGPSHALIEHWDGKRWKRVTVPKLSGRSSLSTISASGRTDIWALGYRREGSAKEQQLLLHYDGTGWRSVRPPEGSPGSGWYEDLAPTSRTTWMVGTQEGKAMYERSMPFLAHTCS